MLSVIYRPFMLSVVMLSVVMMNVEAPTKTAQLTVEDSAQTTFSLSGYDHNPGPML